MATNVEINKKGKENNMSVLKRFQRRVQESGIIPRMRSIRYAERNRSEFVQKKSKLARIARKEEIQKMIKHGKMPERRGRGRRR